MKKKLLLSILSLAFVATSAFSLAACDITIDGDNVSIEDILGALNPDSKEEHEHSFGKWTRFGSGEVDCEEKLFFRTCPECNGIEWKQGTYADHAWDTITVDPTCEKQGYDEKTCATCGKVETTNYTDIIDHVWDIVTIDPTCEKQGYDEKTCATCGKVETTNYTDSTGHAWGDIVETDSTCVTAGTITKTCANCGEENIVKKELLKHQFDETGDCAICKNLVYRLELDGKSYAVSDYRGVSGNIVIPSEYNGLPVTAIASNAFDVVTKAYLKGVIKSVKISDSVTEICTNAFTQCEALSSVVFGKNVKKIGGWVFKDCLALKSVTLPEGLVEIGDSAFRNTGLTSFTVPSTVTTFGKEVFYNCDGLTGEFVIPDSVTSIGTGLFRNASYITSIKLPAGLKEIPNMTFSGCGSLETLILPESIEAIGDQVFYKCSKLKTLYLGENVGAIGGYIFLNMTGLATLNIYYNGTSQMWDDIMMSNAAHSSGFQNDPAAIKERVFFYSKTAPTTEGQFWHYVDGVPTAW